MPSEQLGTDASGVAVQQVQAAGSPPEAGTTQSTAPAGRPQGRLLPVVLPVVAVNLIGSLVLDLLTGADQLIIVDGDLSVTDEGGPVAWLRLGLTVVTWLVALSAAAVAAVGARRGRAVDPRAAMVVALRDLPATALALCVAAGASVGVLWVAAGLTGAVGGAPGMVLIAGVLVALAVVGARLLLGVLTQVFGGSAWQLSRGRLLSTAGVFLLGGIGPPMVAAYLLQQLRAGVRVPVLLDLLDAALLVGTVALQANLLARNYLQPRDTVQAGLAVADLDAVDARLAALAGRRPQWGWLGAAGILLPVLLSAGLAATNPYGLPSIRTTDSIGAVAAAWPAGRHPVVVTTGGVRFCDSDLCDRYVGRHGMAVMDGWSTSTIGPDGTVVTVATTGSEQNGGPFIEYAKCTRAGCRHEFLPVRASAREKYAWPSVAGVAAPDGSVWFAVAMPSSDDESEGSAYRSSMIRCAQVPCT
ncbi:MAG TPA: hypothetical protein VFO77_13170, partial [Actinoplanes sp.]|nr:hypothetical protein [Actinoplanes sp.]